MTYFAKWQGFELISVSPNGAYSDKTTILFMVNKEFSCSKIQKDIVIRSQEKLLILLLILTTYVCIYV